MIRSEPAVVKAVPRAVLPQACSRMVDEKVERGLRLKKGTGKQHAICGGKRCNYGYVGDV